MLRVFIVSLFLGGFLFSENPYGIPRKLQPESSAKERIKVAKAFKDSTLKLTGKDKVQIKTNKGIILCELYPSAAPKTVENFLKLALLGFYDGLKFHRYVEDFVIQGGDPIGTGYGDAGYTIPLEVSDEVKHEKGALGMARSQQDPNSGSSQFYITLRATHELDGKYTVFGKVIEGMDVVLKLREGDRIEKITVIQE